MTIEDLTIGIASLTTATTSLLTAVNVSKATLDTSTANAVAQAASSLTNANAVTAVNTVATTQAGLAAASALSAATARDASISAWSASTAPAELLAAKSQSLHIGTVVKAIVYDTSKDSDGGAWRKRCQDKSWYTETLGGDRWIGQQASIAAAWAAAGSATGAVFQASATAGPITSGQYYSANSATTVTEVFRGVTREFPAVAGIVAESARVVIYDLSTGTMWMVFTGPGATWLSYGSSSIAPLNGVVACASKIANGRLQLLNFISDVCVDYATSATGGIRASQHGVVSRNSEFPTGRTLNAAIGIVDRNVNDIAITVLDNAPIDPATGLPVPTIACATNGGVSVIKDDGTVVNSVSTASANMVAISRAKLLTFSGSSDTSTFRTSYIGSLGSAFAAASLYYTGAFGGYATTGMVNTAISADSLFSEGTVRGLRRFKENPTTPTKGMVAYITDKYNSGWQVGDSRLATLADTTAETLTASGELVTNGTFDTDTSGWTANASSLSVVSGALRVTATSTSPCWAQQVIPTVSGKTYVVTSPAPFFSGGAGAPWCWVVGGDSFTQIAGGDSTSGRTDTFVATGSTTTLRFGRGVSTSGTYQDFDNISVKLAEPDRSVKNNGLIVNGTLTKSPVAAGSNLMAYSGFSATNYLEQPYNPALDFGTGDFCVMGWVTRSSSIPIALLDRQTSAANKLQFQIGGDSRLVARCGASLLYPTTTAAPVGVPTLITFFRSSGILFAYANDTLLGSTACTDNLTSTSVTRIGLTLAGLDPMTGSLALIRISATAPSADQIAHIYRTEFPLFQPNAQCTIAGTSTAVTALAYDDATDLLHVGTSWGRTSFKDLVRVDSEATTTGALTSLSAQDGTIITGGTSAKLYVPAKYLRDELQRKAEARKALGQVPVSIDFTATSGQSAFVLTKGYDCRFVYVNGLLKRNVSDYTVSNDGYQNTVTFTSGITINTQVTILITRN